MQGLVSIICFGNNKTLLSYLQLHKQCDEKSIILQSTASNVSGCLQVQLSKLNENRLTRHLPLYQYIVTFQYTGIIHNHPYVTFTNPQSMFFSCESSLFLFYITFQGRYNHTCSPAHHFKIWRPLKQTMPKQTRVEGRHSSNSASFTSAGAEF